MTARWGVAALAVALAWPAGVQGREQRPLVVSEWFEDAQASKPAPISCAMAVSISDGRSDRRTMGTVWNRAVRSPENVDAWLHNVIAGFGTRGISVRNDQQGAPDAGTLLARLTLKVAWLNGISATKTISVVWNLQLSRGETQLLAKDFRGSDGAPNWASTGEELQHLVDRGMNKALDVMAPEILARCAGS